MSVRIAVHPRGCGEQEPRQHSAATTAGLSPWARGTDASACERPCKQRLIPTGAGNSPGGEARGHEGPVHPRGCGEQAAAAALDLGGCGSSPRVRGTGKGSPARRQEGRFIPAGSGNRVPAEIAPRRSAVHPRGCGEQDQPAPHPRPRSGSSPRVRGTALPTMATDGTHRFIPAGAGNGVPARPAASAPAVHPRGCGEQLSGICHIRKQRGSSPRVRGTALSVTAAMKVTDPVAQIGC